MTATVTITVPMPPTCLGGNARGRTMGAKIAETNARREQRDSAHAQALAAIGRAERWKQAVYVVTATFANNRLRDRDNILRSVKSAIDGFADAVMVGGSDGEIGPLVVLRTVDENAIPSVAIEFRRGVLAFDSAKWQAYFVPT